MMKGLSTLNPVTVLVYYFFAIGIPMFTLDPIIAVTALFFGVTFDILLHKNVGKKYIFIFILFIVSTVINPIFNQSGTTVLFFINDLPITLESLVYGAVSSCALLSVIVWFFTFSHIMTSEKIIYIFGNISPKIALVISMTLRFVPLFLKNYKETENGIKCLGLYKSDTFTGFLHLKMRAFSALLTRCTEDGIITADSMEVRGYGKGKRTFFSVFRFKRTDALYCIFFILLGIICFICTEDMQFYPTLSDTQSGVRAVGYVFYGILTATPAVITIAEDIKWKYLLSKI